MRSGGNRRRRMDADELKQKGTKTKAGWVPEIRIFVIFVPLV